MATKSAFVFGTFDEEIIHNLWEPETDIRIGVWSINLQKVVVKFTEKIEKEFCFCVKSNFVEQNERDKQGKLNVIKSCLGIFSCKGDKDEEIVLENNNSQFFTITRPENELIVTIESPLTKKKVEKETTAVKHKIGCYFIVKRLK
jgi:hypothetical protein